MSLMIAGGDVISYSAVSYGLLRSEARTLTVPAAPNDAHGVPARASSAMSRPSMVATNTRRAHGVDACAAARRLSVQYETPRLVKSPNPTSRSTLGSNFH